MAKGALTTLFQGGLQVFDDQRTLGTEEDEMGAFGALWTHLHHMHGQLALCKVVTLAASYCSRHNATVINDAGYGYVLALKDSQPDLLQEVRCLLTPLVAAQGPETKFLDQDHGRWVRCSLWRTQTNGGWSAWPHLRQAWLVRTEKFACQTTPQTESVPEEVEDHYFITNLEWHRLDGEGILDVVRGH